MIWYGMRSTTGMTAWVTDNNSSHSAKNITLRSAASAFIHSFFIHRFISNSAASQKATNKENKRIHRWSRKHILKLLCLCVVELVNSRLLRPRAWNMKPTRGVVKSPINKTINCTRDSHDFGVAVYNRTENFDRTAVTKCINTIKSVTLVRYRGGEGIALHACLRNFGRTLDWPQ